MEEKMIRNSSFELLRIISMILIVIYHILVHSNVLENATGGLYQLLLFVEILCLVHVNSFILVTGYFQSKSKFNLKKIFNILFSSWFYRIIIVIIFLLLGLVSMTKIEVLENIYFISNTSYRFITCYILLYVFSPFLNKLIGNLTKKQYLILLITYFIFCSVIACLNGYNGYGIGKGYSILNFIFLYFVGAYIRKYVVENNNFSILKNKKLMIYIMIFLTLFFVLFNFLFNNYGTILQGLNGTMKILGNYIKDVTFNYDNPLVILSSVCYFLIFCNMNFYNKIINFIAKNILDIYMIHDHHFVRKFIYPFLGFTLSVYSSYKTIFHIFIAVFIVFLSAYIISLIKTLIFKIFSKLGFVKKINKKLEELSEKYNKVLN